MADIYKRHRRGIWAELTAAAWLIEQGHYVAVAVGAQNPFDLISIDSDGNCMLWDVKQRWPRRKGGTRSRSPVQLRMGVRLLYVTLAGKVQPVKHGKRK